ncbi:MAG: vitamin K epoxide reductase family protein [Patescibacteria group bacterium]
MMNSKPLLTKLAIALLIISFIGFLDATYLTVQHYRGLPPECSIVEGCEEVVTSKYAVMFGVPVALLGGIYYLTIFILSIIYLDSKNKSIIKLAALLTAAGLIASIGFVYLQLFVIKAICVYCMFSAATSTTLFVLGLYILKLNKNKEIVTVISND